MAFSLGKMQSYWQGTLLLVALLVQLPAVHAEFRKFSLKLDPTSAYIHYIDGYLVTPGSIDLAGLRVYTVDDGTDDIDVDDDEFNGNLRRLEEPTGEDDQVEEFEDTDDGGFDDLPMADVLMVGSVLDVVSFPLPENCANSRDGCNWVELGVGRQNEAGALSYCCSAQAIANGLCLSSAAGHIILQEDVFAGHHRMVSIPATGSYDGYSFSKTGKFSENGPSGKYAVVFANCNDYGRTIMIKGETEWLSRGGYLPGTLFGTMYFYLVMFLSYGGLLAWYAVLMKMYEESKIPIQGWILATIGMGCLEFFFRLGDLFVWNEDGRRFWIAYYIGVIVSVMKQGISLCLLVMVSLGWGVTCDDLGDVMKRIHFLGGSYVGIAMIQNIMAVVAYTEVQKISVEEDTELIDIATVLAVVVFGIGVIFCLWTIDSLNTTMEYLENMGQTLKLERFLRLRTILLVAILIAVGASIFGIVDSYDQGIVSQESEWVKTASMELNYLYVLTAVAILWRPQENAKQFAYVMELKATDDDEGADGIELEMTATVPSAMDDDEEEFVVEDQKLEMY
eukprot:Nitzschia sp. Nitz4//scaffold3_size479765//84686//86702//NITZ4_000033-RA/size479765-processed-gene-0.89-mRNA-1//-1//CDS//3329550557//1010//frame0